MKKWMRICSVFIGLILLAACGKSIPDDVKTKPDKPIKALVEDSAKEDVELNNPMEVNLNSDTGLKDYIVGVWICEMEYMTNTVALLKVEEDFKVHLSFYDSQTKKVAKEYEGYLLFDRLYATSEETPDLISLMLEDDEYSEGDYFFLHRTIYDEKIVMSVFFAGNGDSVFRNLSEDNEASDMIEELIFEKVSEEILPQETRKNDQFYAVFWGHGEPYESIWLDDVLWTPPDEGEYETMYPPSMTLYENDEYASLLYQVDKEQTFEILGDDLFKGTVYYIETGEFGQITVLINAEYKKYLEGGYGDNSDAILESEINDIIFDVITNDVPEIQEYLNEGMSILYTDETVFLGDVTCYQIVLGTDHEEGFVRELYYAIDVYNRQVYQYDVLNDVWEPLAVG